MRKNMKITIKEASKLERGAVYAVKLTGPVSSEEFVELKEFVQELRDEHDIHFIVLSSKIDLVHLAPQTPHWLN